MGLSVDYCHYCRPTSKNAIDLAVIFCMSVYVVSSVDDGRLFKKSLVENKKAPPTQTAVEHNTAKKFVS